MSINNIENLESASSIRTKLNEVIALINIYSASIATGSYDYTVTLYDNTSGNPQGTITGETACDTYPGGYSHTIYGVKGGGSQPYPEASDILYYDSDLINYVPSNYYAWYDDPTKKYIQIGSNGVVSTIGECSGGGGNFSATVFSSGPAILSGFGTAIDACNGIANNYTQTVYIQDNTPAGEPNVIAAGDVIYTDPTYTSAFTNPTPVHLGYQITAINYSIYVAPTGEVISVNAC